MSERELPGGRTGGAVRLGDTVRRPAGPWTPAVTALLKHLEDAGFDGAPAPRGLDEQGREILTLLPGETLGDERPWPAWTHSDETLWQVAQWLREYHAVVAGFEPPRDAVWRKGGAWEPGLIIGHNDAAPCNAVWSGERVTGFYGWDFAGPVTVAADLAFTAFAWVPLSAREVAAAEGFTAFADRPRRLRLMLDAYGWRGDTSLIVREVRDRISASIHDIRRLAAAGDAGCRKLVDAGYDGDLAAAVRELATFPR
ncbi:putative aminoglycoside phosphotransferase [Actinoplanes missouriensis 431]|uniref:Putative aminoglycoside phosphotransferase n=1 Tax=Actinoplanes missouriensis (strain ATCC 14538 / DSM 43046 / CBS 188.64 / JCM 3121 / NBRC 102363 / NCIMB 12654 / NRRL B-3342 / UNCC 431) TaxID=512565 RepID=I0HE47_ACTM4|nr:phosphotransferase [Actinoplanes missouriensis]BAL91284.1 putative aminoglycoside phosphotransferase [Actinoplanes missouriensis 431]